MHESLKVLGGCKSSQFSLTRVIVLADARSETSQISQTAVDLTRCSLLGAFDSGGNKSVKSALKANAREKNLNYFFAAQIGLRFRYFKKTFDFIIISIGAAFVNGFFAKD